MSKSDLFFKTLLGITLRIICPHKEPILEDCLNIRNKR